MRTIAEVITCLERLAPLDLAEEWDNVGLLWGDGEGTVSKAMTCLTLSSRTAQEAIDGGAELIVSHHPVLFRPVNRVTADRALPNGFLWSLARNGVAVHSPHTAFDNCVGGINDLLAERIGLTDVVPLRERHAPAFKVVVFTPESDRDAILGAAFSQGAGRIGEYGECSFRTSGTGTFFGFDQSTPAVGQAGRREEVHELRLEFVCPSALLVDVLHAIRQAHSYEEPAIDVYPLHRQPHGPGIGRLGRLVSPEPLQEFARRVAMVLNAPGLHYVGDPGKAIGCIAIVCGAGGEFVSEARKKADALVTGEARYHAAIEADELGLGLVLAGHHATERPGVELLAEHLAAAFPDLDVWPSRSERDPARAV